jgi:hypothetical protein
MKRAVKFLILVFCLVNIGIAIRGAFSVRLLMGYSVFCTIFVFINCLAFIGKYIYEMWQRKNIIKDLKEMQDKILKRKNNGI